MSRQKLVAWIAIVAMLQAKPPPTRSRQLNHFSLADLQGEPLTKEDRVMVRRVRAYLAANPRSTAMHACKLLNISIDEYYNAKKKMGLDLSESRYDPTDIADDIEAFGA